MKYSGIPLAERIRPQRIDQVIGQKHLLAEDKPLRRMIDEDQLRSMIFWGPPGCGKTTIAKAIANHTKSIFYQINAVSSGVKEIREIISEAKTNRETQNTNSILFIDEIHRFNKAQQDALLSSVESGILVLIGATTENPSFEVISPLLSRCQVYTLDPLSFDDLNQLLEFAIKNDEYLKTLEIEVQDREILVQISGNDARILLNGLENSIIISKSKDNKIVLNKEIYKKSFQRSISKYDKNGEEHYNTISAFIKSIRGCDPDAAVFWMSKMLLSGEDPKFIARRMIVLASEDIGNADPYALTLAVSCFSAVDYIGLPEARIVLSQTAIYLASCPKSNASYMAIEEAMEDAKSNPLLLVPIHLRNAVTGLMRNLGYGKEYKYGHNFEENYTDQTYLPEKFLDKIYYKPTNNGREKDIRERLNRWIKNKLR